MLPLEHERVRLRAMRREDAGAYAAGAADPAVRAYAHLPEPEYTEASASALIDGAIREGLARGDLAVLAIADPGTDAFAGSLVLFGAEGDAIEVGFWVHPDHRGMRLAEAALALAEEFARRSGFAELAARTVPGNAASRRVLERSGFRPSGRGADLAPSGDEVELLHYRRTLTSRPPGRGRGAVAARLSAQA